MSTDPDESGKPAGPAHEPDINNMKPDRIQVTLTAEDGSTATVVLSAPVAGIQMRRM